MSITTEVVRRVYDDHEGTFLEIGPDSDGLNLVNIAAITKASKEWFGDVFLTMQPRFARALAQAILACIEEVEEQARKDSNALS